MAKTARKTPRKPSARKVFRQSATVTASALAIPTLKQILKKKQGKSKRKPTAYTKHMSKALKGKMSGLSEEQRKAKFKAAAESWPGK